MGDRKCTQCWNPISTPDELSTFIRTWLLWKIFGNMWASLMTYLKVTLVFSCSPCLLDSTPETFFLNPLGCLQKTFSSCQHQLQQMFAPTNRKQGFLLCAINKQNMGKNRKLNSCSPFRKTALPSARLTDAEVKAVVLSWDAGEQTCLSRCVCVGGAIEATSENRADIPGSLEADGKQLRRGAGVPSWR